VEHNGAKRLHLEKEIIMSRSTLKIAASLVASAMVVAGCGSTTGQAKEGISTQKIALTAETAPSGPLTRNFNPFYPTSADNAVGATSMIYEPLLQFNVLKAGTTYPWLATSYHWSNGGKTLSFDLRKNVLWSDGKPFTSADVVFTFKLLQKYPAINGNGISFTSISAPSAHEVVMNFATPQYVNLFYIGSVYIVPKHLWATVGNPSTYQDANPIGTGPYTLERFTTSGFTLVRNTKYWQRGLPEVYKLVYPAYDSNTTALTALEAGKVQWAGNFIPDVQKLYVQRDPKDHHYWDPATSTQILIPNDETFPFNSLAVRKAFAVAIDRPLISKEVDYGYLKPAVSATGLLLPSQKSDMASSLKSLAYTFDTKKAISILQAAGYVRQKDGFFATKSGKQLNMNLVGPASYTNVIGAYEVMVPELRQAGINAQVEAISLPAWSAALRTGKFQLTWDGSESGPSPYYEFDGWLNSTLGAPIGKAASEDFERYNDPTALALLNSYRLAGNSAGRLHALDGLENIMATDVPVIPFLYGVAWSEYSTRQVVGWPSPANPYMPNSPGGLTAEYVVLHLRPAG